MIAKSSPWGAAGFFSSSLTEFLKSEDAEFHALILALFVDLFSEGKAGRTLLA
jgi:hypothetical protein